MEVELNQIEESAATDRDMDGNLDGVNPIGQDHGSRMVALGSIPITDAKRRNQIADEPT